MLESKKVHEAFNQDMLRIGLEQLKASDFCDDLASMESPKEAIQELPHMEIPSTVYLLAELIHRETLAGLTKANAQAKFNDVTACVFKLSQLAYSMIDTHLDQD